MFTSQNKFLFVFLSIVFLIFLLNLLIFTDHGLRNVCVILDVFLHMCVSVKTDN